MFRDTEPNLQICHKKLGLELVTTGYDSLVFRDGENVRKVYVGGVGGDPPPLSERQFNFYWQITNLAYSVSETEDLFVRLPNSKKSFIFKVNPIITARMCDCGSMEAVSKFVGGDDLESLRYKYDLADMEAGLSQLSRDLEKRLNVEGVKLDPINVKDGGHDILIATDICSDIGRLKRFH
ncbi:MAG: hypothetical protein HYV90_04725 [Candidatus Woesebacteria bacterium]|nr:MAG: hypothetical protein HYV90_04725 [Candidatus Woesebacteria bacterium]